MSLDVDRFIDGWRGRELHGWAWSPSRPASPLILELVAADGRIVAQAPADRFRGDLADAGKRGGQCGFLLEVAQDEPSGELRLRARADGSETVVIEPALAFAAPARAARPEAASAALSDGAGANGWLEAVGPERIAGWLHGGALASPAIPLELLVDGRVAATALADRWRTDIEDLYQGNGRAGFSFPVPEACRDGAAHAVQLRRADTGDPLHPPLTLTVPAGMAPPPPAIAPEPRQPPADAPIALSVIVNVYNMAREAERTLHSLSRRYQRDVADLAYEVICIDNGSNPPLPEEAVTRHGPEFRLFRPSAPHPSPVFALNEAAATARGATLALMIDGAHLLSPGILAEAMATVRDKGAGAVVAVRHWFVGGDQRWLSAVGYSRELEDLIFARIGWPDSGYEIFKVSAPIHDSPNTWFDSMSESNCLFLSADAFAALGGYDTAFSIPGAGFANLDLFARAARRPGSAGVTALIGEATFHQFHDGTTTNVTDAEKERRVRRYASDFTRTRGRSFEAVNGRDIEVRGQVRTDYALNARQRVNGKARLGLTPLVRPLEPARGFDEGSRAFARAAYLETGGHRRSLWAGQPTGVAPGDLVQLQQLLWSERPEVLVLKDVAPGLLGFVRAIMPGLQLAGLKLVWVTRDGEGDTPPGVERVIGDAVRAPAVWAAVEAAVGPAELVSVLVQPRDDEPMPLDALVRYAPLVSVGGYLVVIGTALGQPDLGYAARWGINAVHRFLESGAPFRIDRAVDAHVITACPSGYLRRLPDRKARLDDPALDILDGAIDE